MTIVLPCQLGFQDASSPVMEELLYFHDHALMATLLISAMVLYIISTLMTAKLTHISSIDAQEIEMVWTLMPAIILISIALPSLRILYLMDETSNPDLTVKAIGHQWYWSYEYPDLVSLNFDSYMAPTKTLLPGQLRLLEVDNRILMPLDTMIRVLMTAEDVIHSWTIPSLGIKTDAIPGRLSQTSFTTFRLGLYYGQCSEICGANHSFMPIVLEITSMKQFLKWATT